MRAALALVIALHGLIHLAGFLKVFNVPAVSWLGQRISGTMGAAWLAAAVMFIITALFLQLRKDFWWVFATASVLLSQYLVFTNWQTAKAGTAVNIVILLVAIATIASSRFSNRYRREVKNGLAGVLPVPGSILTEADLQQLPEPVKRYIRLSGAVGKPKVKCFKTEFNGRIRKNEQSPWMPFRSEQYNFMEASTRMFFMKATMKHLPVSGFHSFKNGIAVMDIRLLSLFRVQYQSGKEMNIAETVTFFNDMCCLAPATLIDRKIKWLESDNEKAQAIFENNGIAISAALYFNTRGELVNFISDDRYAYSGSGMIKLRWSTPLKDYKAFGDYTVAGSAETIYHYPEGDLCYGTFQTTGVEYNPRD